METQEPLIEIPLATTNLPTIELDWESYFRTFNEAHGSYPVVYGGRLLYPDGWMYSSTDYEGPEYPPPNGVEPSETKDLHRLIVAYWTRRYDIVMNECNELRKLLTGLERLQLSKSVPLQQRISYRDDEGKTVTTSNAIDLDSLGIRLSWLKEDVNNCKDKLKQLGIHIVERTG